MIYDVLEVCRHTINYSNEMDYDISNLKLQKLLYFIQAQFLISEDIPCFKDRIEAWAFGPVVPKAYKEYAQYGSTNIPMIKSYIVFDINNIWNSERKVFRDNVIVNAHKKIINDVTDIFSKYTAVDLVKLTLNQSPWINAYVPNEFNEISLEALREFFKQGGDDIN